MEGVWRWVRGGYFLARYPTLYDFVEMGFGIERRARRFAKWWRPHLEATRKFLLTAVEDAAPVESLAILGAGRLHDVPFELKQQLSEIHLVDADPSCRYAWRALENAKGDAKVVGTVADVSGVIETWDAALADWCRSLKQGDWAPLEEFLRKLTVPCLLPEDLLGRTPDCVVSLLLISQIPIYWRERFERRVADWGEMPSSVAEALTRTEQMLQERHVEALSRSKAPSIILISDASFFTCHVERANWEATPAHTVDIPELMAQRKLQRFESWFWQVVPPASSADGCGDIHDIEAYLFR